MMGISPKHASSAPLVLNPATGSITPQWNVVFDDWFATVASTTEELPDFTEETWSKLFGTSTSHFPDEEDGTTYGQPFTPVTTDELLSDSNQLGNPDAPIGEQMISRNKRMQEQPQELTSKVRAVEEPITRRTESGTSQEIVPSGVQG